MPVIAKGFLIQITLSYVNAPTIYPQLSFVAYYEDLMAKNQVVINAETSLNNLRITRNILLYTEITGITDVANVVKVYIKSVFGATSPQYKQVSSLKFTNYNQ